jgi:NAD(P)-dependent dehydrogenase (short-subunit alcohol dehydrogenase family)
LYLLPALHQVLPGRRPTPARPGVSVFGTQYQTRIIESTITMIPMNVDDDIRAAGYGRLYEEAGRLDAVVNSAGWLLIGSIEDTSLAEAEAQLETNFLAYSRIQSGLAIPARARERAHRQY